MAKLKVHEEDCTQLLGEPFTEVHEWLDEMFKYAGAHHRGYRHHFEGVKEVR